MKEHRLQRLFDGGLYFEGSRWHEGRLWLADSLQRTLLSMDSAGNAARVCDIKGIAGGAGFLPNGELVVASMRARKLLKLVGGQLAELRRAIRPNLESSPTVAISLGNDQTLIIGHSDAVWKAGALRHSFRASIGPSQVAILVRVWASLYQEDSFVRVDAKGRALDRFLLPSVDRSRVFLGARSTYFFCINADTTHEGLLRGRSTARGRDRCKRLGCGKPIGHTGRRDHKTHARLVKNSRRRLLKHPLGFEARTS